MKISLRIISLIMLIVAILFLTHALMHPEAGSTFCLLGIPIGVAVWQIFYVVYVAVMTVLFVISFFCKKETR